MTGAEGAGRFEHARPADIERTSMRIIAEELRQRGLAPAPEDAAAVMRAIHATADFDYAETLAITPGAVQAGAAALRAGCPVVTDTNMALAGVSKPALARLGCEAFCLMADPAVAERACAEGTTRAVAAVRRAAELWPGAVFAVGNAPTALAELASLVGAGLRPALVVGVPVGFVNVVEAKELALEACRACGVPAVVARGRKGGSTVAAAILNAVAYEAAGMLDPAARGWQG